MEEDAGRGAPGAQGLQEGKTRGVGKGRRWSRTGVGDARSRAKARERGGARSGGDTASGGQ